MSAEQWQEDGNCNECRRQKYCGTTCKAHKIAIQRAMRKVLLEALAHRKVSGKIKGQQNQEDASVEK